MIVNGPWSTADVLSGPAFKSSSNFQVAVIPPGPGGQGSPIGGASFVISRNSKHVDAAYTFIKWLTAPAQQARLRVEEQPPAEPRLGLQARRP